jgi:hypothetical protein
MSAMTSVRNSHHDPQPPGLADPEGGLEIDDGPDLDDWSERSLDAAQVWPAGPLDAAQRAFDLLTRPPAPLAFDCRGIEGLPQRIVGLDELKHLLIGDAISRGTRDLVWSQVVTRARRDGPAWVVAAVGIALPALRFRAGLLTRGWHGDVADLDGELVLGFLERLKTVDLDAGNIAARLVEAGARAVKLARSREGRGEAVAAGRVESIAPARPWDHPDLVLARAVAAAVIGAEESLLIGATRLEDIPLRAVAERLGVSCETASAWRWRAERDLGEAIAAGELQWVGLESRRRAPACTAARCGDPNCGCRR